MDSLRVWQRLLWKLRREAGMAPALIVIIPPLGMLLARSFKNATSPGELISLFLLEQGSVLAAWAVAVMLVTSRASSDTRQGSLTADHLPVPPLWNWLQGFLIPAGTLTLAGLWVGTTGLALQDIPIWSVKSVIYLAFWMLAWAASLGIAHLYAAAFGTSAGTLAGTWLGMASYVALSGAKESHLLPSSPYHSARWGSDVLALLATVAVAVVGVWLGTLIYTVLAARKPVRYRRELSLGASILICVVSLGSFAGWEQRAHPPSGSGATLFWPLESPDGSLRVELAGQSGGKQGGATELVLRDYRDGFTALARFELYCMPIGFEGRRVCYVADAPGQSRSRVRISRWDSAGGGIAPVAEFPLPRGFRLFSPPSVSYSRFRAWVRPDGRYILAMIPSDDGRNGMLWVVDTRSGSARVVAAGFSRAFPIGTREEIPGWRSDGRVVFPCYAGVLVVDLASGKAEWRRVQEGQSRGGGSACNHVTGNRPGDETGGQV